MTENREETVSGKFGRELRSFFALCLLNLVFGSLAMAFGMQFIVTAALAMASSGELGAFPFVQVLAGWAAAVIGFRWILSGAKVLKGVNRIRREYRALEELKEGETRGGQVSGDALTGLILGMMAHYRENWTTIWRMNLICIAGGCIFLALGVLNLLQGFSAWHAGGSAGFPLLFPFLAAMINLAVGTVSLLFSSWFRRYSRAWDRRLIEASRSGEALLESMEQG